MFRTRSHLRLRFRPHVHLRSRSGISLVIAMLMVMAFMLMMASTMTAMNRSLNIAKGGAASDQAYLNAVVGLELGMYRQNHGEDAYKKLISDMGVTEKDGVVMLPNGNQKSGQVKVQVADNIPGGGKVCTKKYTAQEVMTDIDKDCPSDKYYVYPFPGTGTLGSSYCNPASQPAVKNEQWYKDMYYYVKGTPYTGTGFWTNGGATEDEKNVLTFIDQEKLTALDHPCLWNKLEPGVGAEIPLGSDTSKISEFWLRVRLPCKSGVVCNTEPNDLGGVGRMQLFIDPKTDKDNTRTLLWEVVARCEKANCFIRDLGPNSIGAYQPPNKIDQSVKNVKKMLQHSLINLWSLGIKNKTIYSTLSLNNVTLGLVNNGEPNGPAIYASNYEQEKLFTTIKDFFKKKLSNPIMHLSIANNLLTSNGNYQSAIPYVEYQVLYKKDPDLDNKPLITNPTVLSTGSYGGYSIDLQTSLTKQVGTFGYGLIGK